MDGRIRIEDRELVIEVGKTRTATGTNLMLENLEGWTQGPGVRRNSTQRLANHGNLSVRGWRDQRVLSVEGSGWSDTRGEAGDVVDELAGFLGDGKSGTVRVIDPDQGTRWVKCFLDGEPEVDWETDTDYSFAYDLVCPDGRKYGTQEIGGTTGVATPGGGLRFPLFAGAPLQQTRRNHATNPAYATTLAPSAGSTNATAVWEGAGGHPEAGEGGRARVTSTAAGLVRLGIQSIPVQPGEPVTLSFWIRASAAGRNLRAQIDWNGAAGYITAIISGNISAPGGVWQRVSISGIAPAGATSAFAFARMENAAAGGEIFVVDGVLIEKSLTGGPYFDGSTTDTATTAYQWEGTPHASPSTSSAYGGRRGILDFGKAGSTGTVAVRNTGTAEINPAFVIGGGGTERFTITELETGRRLVYAQEVPSSQELTLDGATGSVLLNGYAERSGGLVRAEWGIVPARSTRTYLYEAPGLNSTMTVKANPAWI